MARFEPLDGGAIRGFGPAGFVEERLELGRELLLHVLAILLGRLQHALRRDEAPAGPAIARSRASRPTSRNRARPSRASRRALPDVASRQPSGERGERLSTPPRWPAVDHEVLGERSERHEMAAGQDGGRKLVRPSGIQQEHESGGGSSSTLSNTSAAAGLSRSASRTTNIFGPARGRCGTRGARSPRGPCRRGCRAPRARRGTRSDAGRRGRGGSRGTSPQPPARVHSRPRRTRGRRVACRSLRAGEHVRVVRTPTAARRNAIAASCPGTGSSTGGERSRVTFLGDGSIGSVSAAGSCRGTGAVSSTSVCETVPSSPGGGRTSPEGIGRTSPSSTRRAAIDGARTSANTSSGPLAGIDTTKRSGCSSAILRNASEHLVEERRALGLDPVASDPRSLKPISGSRCSRSTRSGNNPCVPQTFSPRCPVRRVPSTGRPDRRGRSRCSGRRSRVRPRRRRGGVPRRRVASCWPRTPTPRCEARSARSRDRGPGHERVSPNAVPPGSRVTRTSWPCLSRANEPSRSACPCPRPSTPSNAMNSPVLGGRSAWERAPAARLEQAEATNRRHA